MPVRHGLSTKNLGVLRGGPSMFAVNSFTAAAESKALPGTAGDKAIAAPAPAWRTQTGGAFHFPLDIRQDGTLSLLLSGSAVVEPARRAPEVSS